jgi:ssRNA-specific RNase YbeY (16S rRNA maturation enzyme)
VVTAAVKPMAGDTFSIINRTRSTIPPVPFKKIKETVLGKKHELSLVFVGPTESRAITKKTKRKDKVSNVLAFPLSKSVGEIIICPSGKGEYTLGYLFIHGLLHIKGHEHSDTMDDAEERLLARFNLCKKSSQESMSARTKSK